MQDTIGAGGAKPSAEIKVWDPFVRIFHWSLVVLFFIAFTTGDEIEWLHIAAGYGIAGLVTLRIVWGLIGTRHARFGDFVKSPGAVLAYLRDVIRFKAPRTLGHNPAGGAMIVALLVMLTGTCVTGYMMTTDAYWGVKWVKELHEVAANATIALVALHVFGVIVSSMAHRENLVRAMFTGRKRVQ